MALFRMKNVRPDYIFGVKGTVTNVLRKSDVFVLVSYGMAR